MTDTKISPCPMPGCITSCYAEQQEDFSYRIACTICGYRSQRCSLVEDAIVAHNQLCEYVNLGKAFKKVRKVIEMNNEMARRARKFMENPPECPRNIGMGVGRWEEFRNGHARAIKDCLNFFKVESGGDG